MNARIDFDLVLVLAEIDWHDEPTQGLIVMIIFFGLFVVGWIYVQIMDPIEKKRMAEEVEELKRKQPDLVYAKRNLDSALTRLSSEVTLCSRCNSSVFQLWNYYDTNVEIRCVECKKKRLLSVEQGLLEDLYNSTSKFFKLRQIPNEMLEPYRNSNFRFDELRSGTPLIRAITFEARGKLGSEAAPSHGANPRHIPRNVKDQVWRRDSGKCVECGSQERLEFDHIIPYSKGGASTYRNVQLLCETCNRKKSDKIG